LEYKVDDINQATREKDKEDKKNKKDKAGNAKGK
jgi:hypothetical protein